MTSASAAAAGGRGGAERERGEPRSPGPGRAEVPACELLAQPVRGRHADVVGERRRDPLVRLVGARADIGVWIALAHDRPRSPAGAPCSAARRSPAR
jgi:hypothetical protein